jgi:hypothetical protein
MFGRWESAKLSPSSATHALRRFGERRTLSACEPAVSPEFPGFLLRIHGLERILRKNPKSKNRLVLTCPVRRGFFITHGSSMWSVISKSAVVFITRLRITVKARMTGYLSLNHASLWRTEERFRSSAGLGGPE